MPLRENFSTEELTVCGEETGYSNSCRCASGYGPNGSSTC